MTETDAFVLKAGTVLEGYTIRRQLGAGGFGVTYLAEEALIGRKVAIKEFFPRSIAGRSRDGAAIKPHDPASDGPFRSGLASFRDEARMLLNFEHPNIVPLLKYFEANGTGYMVMPFIEGQPLDKLIDRDRRLTQDEIDEILPPILDGLAAVHAQRILHRDIKPANIFIRKDGRPVLIDFGAARIAIGEHSKDFTAILTHGFAPMEQYHEGGRLGPWTDLYALGATLYRCITGRIPPAATERSAARGRGRPDPLPPLDPRALPEYRPGLLAAITAALAYDDEERPQSVAQFREILDGGTVLLGGETKVLVREAANKPGPTLLETVRHDPSRKRRVRRRFRWRAALPVAAIALAGAAVAAVPAWRERVAELFAGPENPMEARRANECDRLAAFEFSPHNVPGVRGVSFQRLTAHVEDAIKACGEAARRFRREARFRVYLARALSAKKDHAAGLALLRPFAEAGDPSSQTSLAIYYELGDGVPRDLAEAVRLYNLAIAQKYTRAMIQLSLLYQRGSGIARDDGKAFELMREAAAAGHAVAQSNLGVWYRSGRGVAKDPAAALLWLRLAADRGYATAMVHLGHMFVEGEGTPKDDAKALEWYRKAAEDRHPEAQFSLGWMHEHGRGVPVDLEAAIRWYRLAAEQGNSDAINALGYAHQTGRGVAKDIAEAIRLYERAAGMGNRNAMFNLGWVYDQAIGVPADPAAAARHYRQAAELGHVGAMNNLGVLYEYGKGVPQDYGEAVKWYRRAAETGHPIGQFNLGSMYERGLGVAKDVAEAVLWYVRAAKQGNEEAKQALARLGHKYE